MTMRLVKIIAAGLFVGCLIYFAPKEIEYGAAATYFIRRLGWAASTPYWGCVAIGEFRSVDVWLLGIAAVVAALIGGTFGALVCLAGALSRKLSYWLIALSALIAIACFFWAPYQMGLMDVYKPMDLVSKRAVPYVVLAVFTVWLLFQNILYIRAVERTLETSLVTLGGSIVAVVVSFPLFFYILALGVSFHSMFWPSMHMLD
jgi:hypothetical protein